MRSLLCPLIVVTAVACTSTKTNVAPTMEAHGALEFIEDNYPRAMTEAKAKKLPVFVDIWAPW